MKIIRGSVVRFRATFVDPLNVALAPTSAATRVWYLDRSGASKVDEVAMTQDGLAWVGVWDTTPAAPGEIDWTITCAGPVQGAKDGQFVLAANKSNP